MSHVTFYSTNFLLVREYSLLKQIFNLSIFNFLLISCAWMFKPKGCTEISVMFHRKKHYMQDLKCSSNSELSEVVPFLLSAVICKHHRLKSLVSPRYLEKIFYWKLNHIYLYTHFLGRPQNLSCPVKELSNYKQVLVKGKRHSMKTNFQHCNTTAAFCARTPRARSSCQLDQIDLKTQSSSQK